MSRFRAYTFAHQTIDVVVDRHEQFRKQAALFQEHVEEVTGGEAKFDKGKANRLNDYVHELQGFLNNLERHLHEAGKD